ncbi:ATP-binding protein [Streptomyces sp. NBC_01381]|uniref:hypothetical protein n=1 Tax=Streptomyces sp. NBC_01381 TaxID=2903845 RepID=UPI00225B59FE|nr:hypothetical protein [Streptomyces sp. NBC_01381]MCX4671848.1 ATP-binding protein [Streptomyces sp. NBC_01381]
MDPRRLAAVQVGDAKYIHANGSGYLLTPHLVLTALHVLTLPKKLLTQQRIDVVVGHPDHGDRLHRSGWLRWSASARDVALIQLNSPVDVPGEVLWGRPVAGVLDYEALGFPNFARYDGEQRIEHLTGRLPALGQGAAGGLVLDLNAAPRPRLDRRNWGGVSGAAVFCADCLVGVVVMDDADFGDLRLHGVSAHTFAQDDEFVGHLGADGGRKPTFRRLTGRVPVGQGETASAPQSLAPIDELRQLSEEYLGSAATASMRVGPHGPFFGRDTAIRSIEEWLRPAPGTTASTALVVTGIMGSGKSALLGRTALSHDEYGRQTVAHEPTPETGGVGPVLTARLSLVAMNAARLTRVLGAACGVDADTVADIVTAPTPAVGKVPVVLLDALDEADRPEQLCRTVIAPLIESREPRVRLLIGTRSHLLPLLQRLGVRTIDLDGPDYADRKALERAVRHELTNHVPHSVWRDAAPQDTLAAAVRQVADRAGTSFLLAGLLARALARRPAVGLPSAAEWRQLAEDGIHGALQADLTERLGDRLPWAKELLKPLAFARGAGLPSAHVWPQAASILHGHHYTAYDIRELLRVLSDYVVATTMAGADESDTSFRLFHTALADWLAKGHDADAAHQAIAQALIDAVPQDGATPDWHAASRYTLDHLAMHARSAHTLRTILDDPGFLLHSDQAAVLDAVNRADVPRTAQALRATTALRHDTPATVRAQILQAAARRCGADTLADRLDDCCCPPALATRWSRRRRILDDELPTGFDGSPRDVIALSWRGQPVCVVLGSRHHEDFLQVLDLETRSPVGEIVPTGTADGTRLLGPVRTSRGMTVVYRSGDCLRRWSMDEGRHIRPDLLFDHEENGSRKSVWRFTLGRIADRTVAVVATLSGRLYCFDLEADSPHPIHEPQPIEALPLNGLALAHVRGEPAVVCLSYGRVECRALGDGSTLSAPWEVAGGLGDIVLLDRQDRPGEQALAGFRLRYPMTDDEFAIDLWDPLTGEILDTNAEYREERCDRWPRRPEYESAWIEEFDGRRRLFLTSGRERYERDPRTGARIGPPCQLRRGAVELTVHGERHTLGIEEKRLLLREAGHYALDPFDPSTWPPAGLIQETYPPPAEPEGPAPLVGLPARAGMHRGRPVFLVTTPYTGHERRTATLVDARTGVDLSPPWTIPVPPDEITAIDWAVVQGRLMVLAFHAKLVMDQYQGKATVLIWDPERRTMVRRMSIVHPGQVVGVHTPGTPDLLYLTVHDGPDLLWDLTSDTFTPVSCPEQESLHAFARRGPYVCIPPGDSNRLGNGRVWRMAATDRAEATPIRLLPPDADERWRMVPDTLDDSDAIIDVGGRTTALRLRQRGYRASDMTLEVYLLPTATADPEPVRRRWWRRQRALRIAGHTFPLEVSVDHVVPAANSKRGRFYAVGGSLLTGFSLEWKEEVAQESHDEPTGRGARVAPSEPFPVLYQDHDSYDTGARILHMLTCPGEGVALFTEDGVTFVTDRQR